MKGVWRREGEEGGREHIYSLAVMPLVFATYFVLKGGGGGGGGGEA